MIRFQQCCSQIDFIVWRMNVNYEDQFSDKKTSSTGNIVICHQDNKNLQIFIKQIQTLVNRSSLNGQNNKIADHGSLFNCMQPYLKNGKISFIECVLNEYDQIQSHLNDIKRIPSTFMNKNTTYKINPLAQSYQVTNKQINRKNDNTINYLKKQISSIITLSSKQIQKFKQIFNSYKLIIKQSSQKLSILTKYCRQLIQRREQFYQQQKFPISLQIKEIEDKSFLIKSYYIAKIYSLSQKYQMACLQSTCQKMTTIKNQIQLAIKSILCTINKKLNKCQNNSNSKCQYDNSLNKSYQLNNSNLSSKSYLLNNSQFIKDKDKQSMLKISGNKKSRSNSIQKIDKSQQKYNKLLKIIKIHLQNVKKNIKFIMNIKNTKINEQKQKRVKSKKNKQQINSQFDIPKLLGQQLVNQLQRLIKTITNKRDAIYQQNTINNSNIQILVQPKNELSKSITFNQSNIINQQKCMNKQNQSNNNKKQKTQNKKMTKILNIQGSNSRIIVFKQRQKNNSQYVKQQPINYENKQLNYIKKQSIKRRIKKINEQNNKLQKSLLQIKKEQLQKQILIRQKIDQFTQHHNLTKTINNLKLNNKLTNQNKQNNDTKLNVNQKHHNKDKLNISHDQSNYLNNISKLDKIRIKSQKQNHLLGNQSNHLLKTNQQKYQNKRKSKLKYQLIYHNQLQNIQFNLNHQNNPHLQISNLSHLNQQNTHKKSNNKLNSNPSIARLHHRQNSTILLPQIKSCQKSNDKSINQKNTVLHSPKNKKKRNINIIKNSIINQNSPSKNINTSPIKKNQIKNVQNKSFLPQISLVCKKIIT